MNAAVRHRFDRETVPEPYEVRAAGLELGRINRMRRESDPPAPKPPQFDATLAVALAIAIILLLVAGT